MQFVDEVTVTVRSGDGGAGCVSFRREKFVPRGGPNGGDGGRGGDVIFQAEPRLTTLLDLRYRKSYLAKHGQPGQGWDRHGRNAANVIIPVPCGSVIRDAESGELLADLTLPGQRLLLARGGKGGHGNAWFKSATHRTPRLAQPGEPGEEKRIQIELKLLADVGLVGLPNAGKSTLLSRISAAHPKIADYPFTTKAPVLGVVKVREAQGFVVADLPGLIEGASRGRGLGIRFLKHAERTRVLLHLVDCSSSDPLRDVELINAELSAFHPQLGKKPQLVVLTKTDLVPTLSALEARRRALKRKGRRALAVSAVTGQGIPELLDATVALLFPESKRRADGADRAGEGTRAPKRTPKRARKVRGR
jgi:GTP-binding protein